MNPFGRHNKILFTSLGWVLCRDKCAKITFCSWHQNDRIFCIELTHIFSLPEFCVCTSLTSQQKRRIKMICSKSTTTICWIQKRDVNFWLLDGFLMRDDDNLFEKGVYLYSRKMIIVVCFWWWWSLEWTQTPRLCPK